MIEKLWERIFGRARKKCERCGKFFHCSGETWTTRNLPPRANWNPYFVRDTCTCFICSTSKCEECYLGRKKL